MEKKADLKTMTWKQRIGFVWDYYRLVILAALAYIQEELAWQEK